MALLVVQLGDPGIQVALAGDAPTAIDGTDQIQLQWADGTQQATRVIVQAHGSQREGLIAGDLAALAVVDGFRLKIKGTEAGDLPALVVQGARAAQVQGLPGGNQPGDVVQGGHLYGQGIEARQFARLIAQGAQLAIECSTAVDQTALGIEQLPDSNA